jgi:hypothetical protein
VSSGGITTPFVYTPTATDNRSRVAAGLAAAINANSAAGFKAVAQGETLLILDPGATTAFTATLKFGQADIKGAPRRKTHTPQKTSKNS